MYVQVTEQWPLEWRVMGAIIPLLGSLKAFVSCQHRGVYNCRAGEEKNCGYQPDHDYFPPIGRIIPEKRGRPIRPYSAARFHPPSGVGCYGAKTV